ncbi:MAG: DJ-1/PfpI family protein [Deltaproteobacteria bacterium]|nr:DJ-1/PfpI family protein [Deltaproteobacteria bacterium]
MSIKVLVPISTGFEEIETTTIVDVLRRGGINVVLAGVTEGPIQGRSAIRVLPDCTLDEALKDASFDALVLPGGQPNAQTLTDDSRIISLLKSMNNSNRLVAAICAAPTALHAAGLLKNRKATIFPECRDDIPKESYVEEDVVISDGVITSRGPATAMSFSLTLIETLRGKDVADKVSAAVLAS